MQCHKELFDWVLFGVNTSFGHIGSDQILPQLSNYMRVRTKVCSELLFVALVLASVQLGLVPSKGKEKLIIRPFIGLEVRGKTLV